MDDRRLLSGIFSGLRSSSVWRKLPGALHHPPLAAAAS
ncbi:hypothetical protein F4V88_21810 [Neorhizobium galegae]|nr:hypothetical protein F4V88_21810 [Neorhizobium galegae]